MRPCLLLVAAAASVSVLVSPGVAQDARTRIARGKAATAFVEVEAPKPTVPVLGATPVPASSASAFCIHASGIFVTNHHVVKSLLPGGKVRLVLDPNGEKPRILAAQVLRSDATEDLAVLKAVDAKDPVPVLELGNDGELFETMPVTAFGYPFGRKLSVGNGSYPEITVSAGRITSLRRQEGKLQRIQVDAQLNPGDSGGPVLDDSGTVVGIVQAGVLAAGVSFVIPTSRLRPLLRKPDVTVEMPDIPHDGRHAEQVAVVKVVPITDRPAGLSVELEVQMAGQEPRKIAATAAGEHRYEARFVPLAKSSADEKVWIEGVATYPGGAVTGKFEDRDVRVGTRTVRLRDVRRLERSAPVGLLLHDGSRLDGAPQGIDELNVDLGPVRIVLPFAEATRFEGSLKTAGIPRGSWTAIVRDGTTELAKATGMLVFKPDPQAVSVAGTPTGSAPATGSAPTTPATPGTPAIPGTPAKPVSPPLPSVPKTPAPTAFRRYTGGDQTLELPESVGDVVQAAGGRLLLLHLPKSKKIAVYDVDQAKIARYLDLASSDVIVVAGLEHLFVVARNERMVERWSLSDFRRETVKPLPDGVQPSIAALGAASTGPVLLLWFAGQEFAARPKYSLLDPESLELKDLTGYVPTSGYLRTQLPVRASAVGDVYAFWTPGLSPSGVEVLAVVDGTAKGHRLHESAGHVVPSFDGSAILTGTGRILTPELASKANVPSSILLPATHPRFCVAIPLAQVSSFPRFTPPGTAAPAAANAAIVSVSDGTRLVDLPNLGLGRQDVHPARIGDESITFDRRILFVPQADQIVVLPATNDRLLVKRFSLTEALDKAGSDYLYVTSIPPRIGYRGHPWSYRIEVASKAPGVAYELASGPEGMRLAADGKLDWDVPPDRAPGKVSIVVIVKNEKGRSLYETFAVDVR